jgi:transcriptional regulator with XRE-family HTH domain
VSSKKPDYRHIVGAAIRKQREAVGLSQEKLAEKSDLHHNFIGEVERGNMDISIGSLIKVAKALSIRPSDLLADL